TGKDSLAGGPFRNLPQEVGQRRALVGRAYAGYRGHQVGPYRSDVADGRPAVAVAEQVDLALAGEGDDLLDLLQQLLAAGFGRIQLADLGDVHRGAILAQGLGDAVPVVDAEHAVPAEHAVGQDDGVLGSGVIGG